MMVWLCAYYEFYDKKVHQCCSHYSVTPLMLMSHFIGDI